MPVITIELTPEMEKFVHSCVESGRYKNVSEVVCYALRLYMKQEEKRMKFIAMLNFSMEQARGGEGHSLEEVMEEAQRIIDADNDEDLAAGRRVDIALSHRLVEEAKRYGGFHQRSASAQIERWAYIGKMVEGRPDVPYSIIMDVAMGRHLPRTEQDDDS